MLKSQDSKLDFTHSHHPVPNDWVMHHLNQVNEVKTGNRHFAIAMLS